MIVIEKAIIADHPVFSISMPILNGMELLEPMTAKAIDHIERNTSCSYELIIVRHDEEESIAKAHNAGLSTAKGSVLCCLHNDTMVQEGWEIPLIEIASKGDIGFPMFLEDKNICEAMGTRPLEPWMTSSCCFMLSHNLFTELCGYDEDFIGIHYEDYDLFMRAKESGAKLVRADSEVVHLRSITRAHGDPEREKKYFEINHELYMKKHAHKYGGTMPIPALLEVPNAPL